ncbi:hypothetical protein [Delftia sp. PS-11]|uniref:hypothetical protein n=1 Tax=Delftia sp. PS-11 TaxID=2767222 RepID=UPI002458090D|nr:hypothetical protein [Delftia sp. PS-11]KAJ8742629.1 hypothetical protein H9T68_19290 [Delftia sp. PS-11]
MINNIADLFTRIWILDEASIGATLVEALKNGQAVIYDGVAYWAEGSGKTGIIQHLKFTERTLDASKEILEQLKSLTSATQAIQHMQNMLMAAQVISTVAVVGAIVIQTQYLGRKLDAIQSTVDEISASQHEQNLVFYMDKIGDYIGSVEYARSLLQDRTLVPEIRDITAQLLPHIGSKRNHIISLVDNIAAYVRSSSKERNESKNFKLMLDFIHLLVDVLPAALHTEHLLAARVGKPRLAQQILQMGAMKYEQVLGSYRGLMNQLHREAVSGVLSSSGEKAFLENKPKLLEIINSPVNQLLLFKQSASIAI